jgi:hypothetical protein
MKVNKIIREKAVAVRFSVLELSAWGLNPRHAAPAGDYLIKL